MSLEKEVALITYNRTYLRPVITGLFKFPFNKSFRNDEGTIQWREIIDVIILACLAKFIYDVFLVVHLGEKHE